MEVLYLAFDKGSNSDLLRLPFPVDYGKNKYTGNLCILFKHTTDALSRQARKAFQNTLRCVSMLSLLY